jgi:rubrerythrin
MRHTIRSDRTPRRHSPTEDEHDNDISSFTPEDVADRKERKERNRAIRDALIAQHEGWGQRAARERLRAERHAEALRQLREDLDNPRDNECARCGRLLSEPAAIVDCPHSVARRAVLRISNPAFEPGSYLSDEKIFNGHLTH